MSPTLRRVMSDQEPEPRFVDTTGAARILGMSVVTVRRRAAAGELPGVRIGGEWRFLVSELAALGKPKPPTP